MNSSSENVPTWKAILSGPSSCETPKSLAQSLDGLVQLHPYLPEAERAEITHALIESPLKESSLLGPLWARTCYGVGGQSIRDALASHGSATTASAQSQADAQLYAELLDAEAEFVRRSPNPTPREPTESASLLPRDSPLTIAALTQHFSTRPPKPAITTLRDEAGYAPVLASDCDGTTWSGDIGDAFFEAAIRDGWFEPQALPLLQAFTDRIGLPTPNDPTDAARLLQELHESGELVARGEERGISKNTLLYELYELQGRAYVGKSIVEIKARTRDIFETTMASQIFPEMQELFDLARDQGIVPIAVSASCHWQVEVGASYLGVPPRLCLGVRSKVENEMVGETLNLPMTYGPGKVEALRSISPCPPIMAIGDSWQRTDRELLKDAALGLVVVHEPDVTLEGLHPFYIPT